MSISAVSKTLPVQINKLFEKIKTFPALSSKAPGGCLKHLRSPGAFLSCILVFDAIRPFLKIEKAASFPKREKAARRKTDSAKFFAKSLTQGGEDFPWPFSEESGRPVIPLR